MTKFLTLAYSSWLLTSLCFIPGAIAQVTSDNTLSTTVDSPDGVNFTIENGDSAGSNLFHSFQDFSVPNNGSATFNNALEVENIFSRVTGGNISNIEGAINAGGTANLLLINPAGIVFGENASLNIGGSFFATTADSLLFESGEFSAVNPQAAPLLTINRPIGLNFGDNPGNIINRSNFGLQETSVDIGLIPEFTVRDSVGLQVNEGETISLIGGNILLEDAAGITASGGIELGGLSQAGTITINPDGSLVFPEGLERVNVTLKEQSRVNVTGNNGGFININAKNLELSQQSELFAGIAEDNGALTSTAGDINIDATESVKITGELDASTGENFEEQIQAFTFTRDYGPGIRNNLGFSSARRSVDRNRSNAVGNGGDINITTATLELSDVAVIDTSIFGTGNGGDINIDADDITLTGSQSMFLSQVRGFNLERIREQGIGDGGNLNINTGSISLIDGAEILFDVQPGAIGNGGNININASDSVDLIVKDGFGLALTQLGRDSVGSAGDIKINANSILIDNFLLISDASSDSQGDGGNIILNAKENISLDNQTLLLTQIQSGATGDGGDINLNAGSISLNNLSLVSSNTGIDSLAEAGDINITSRDSLDIRGGSAIDVLTQNNFAGGDLRIEASSLNLIDGGKLVASGDSAGNAGNINLTIAGDITIDNRNPPTESLFTEAILQNLNDEAGIFANTIGDAIGSGGNINIAANSIFLNNRGSISAATVSNAGGNVSLQLQDLLSLRKNSSISARSEDFGSGGNITINTNIIFASPNQNNDIIANAQQGLGGNIDITAESILGIEERNSTPLNNTNDLDVSSDLSIDGTVTINNPDVDPTSGIIELTTVPIDAEAILAQDLCRVENENIAGGSSFIITGRGGLTRTSAESLDNINRVVGWTDGSQLDRDNSVVEVRRENTTAASQPVVQSQGLMVAADGSLWLTANSDRATTQTVIAHPDCNS